MQDLLINLLASIIAGSAVWSAQRLLSYRRINRRRRFFGVRPDEEVLLHVSRHSSSPRPKSVHRDDVAALIELATTIKACGGLPVMMPAGEPASDRRRATEFCVGGPSSNPRVAAYLRTTLPGIVFSPFDAETATLSFSVGQQRFDHVAGREEYALLVRMLGANSGHPVFLVMGQKAHTNLAAARYLAANVARLRKSYPKGADFCLVLKLREPATFGTDDIELVADLTAQARTPAPAPETSESR